MTAPRFVVQRMTPVFRCWAVSARMGVLPAPVIARRRQKKRLERTGVRIVAWLETIAWILLNHFSERAGCSFLKGFQITSADEYSNAYFLVSFQNS